MKESRSIDLLKVGTTENIINILPEPLSGNKGVLTIAFRKLLVLSLFGAKRCFGEDVLPVRLC